MRNLRRFYAVAIAIAMLVGMLAPVAAFAAGSDYAADANVLHNLGLYQGIDKDKFNPDLDSTLNRQTAATMVLRMFGLEQAALDMDEKDAKAILADKFKDASSVDGWALKQVAYAVDNDIIKGFPDGTFQPKGLLTGRQYCTLVLKNLGYTDFTFEAAGKKFAEVSGASAAEQAAFDANSAIKKNILVGISRKALDAKMENGKVTLIQQLVNEKAVTEKAATDAGYGPFAPAPTTTPTATTAPSSVPSTVYGSVNATWTAEAGKSVARGQALVQLGKITLKAEKDLTVTGVKLSRTGLSADSDISNVTVWDGVKKLNVPAIFSNATSVITFTSPVSLVAGVEKTLTVKTNVATAAVVASQINIAVTEISAPNTVTVLGQLPFVSGTMTVAQVSLGTLTVKRSSDEPTTNLNAGTTDQRLAKFDFVAVTENQTLNNVTFIQNGSVADTDIKNLKLFDGSTQLGATAELKDRKVTFEFTKEISAGATLRLSLKGDVVGGAGRTLKFGISDVNDVQATGKTYGTTIVGSLEEPAGTAKTSIDGKELSINQGSFIISKSTSTAPASTISTVVDDQAFGTFKVEAIGEPIQLRTFKVKANVTDVANGGAGSLNAGFPVDLTDLKIKNGTTALAQVETPFTITNAATDTKDVTLSTPITVNPGSPVELTLTADIKSTVGADATDKYTLGVAYGTASALTGVGNVSGKDVTSPATADIYGNEMTVGTLAVTATVVPASDENVFKSESARKLVEFDVKHNLGEAVDISTLVLTLGDPGSNNGVNVSSNLTNAKIVDNNNVVLSEVKTAVLAATEGNVSFALNNPLTIAAGQTVRIGLVADVLSTATATNNYQFGFDTTTVARTVAAGTDVTVTDLAANAGKTVTISNGGSALLAVRADATNIENANVYAGNKDVKIGAYSFYSDTTGVEPGIIKKVVLKKITTVDTRETVTVNFAGNTTVGSDTYSYTLKDAAGTGNLAAITGTIGAGNATAIATSVAAAINANAAASALYSATASTSIVTLVRKDNKAVTDLVAGAFVITDDAADSTIVAPTVTVTKQGTVGGTDISASELGSQYFSNIRLVNAANSEVVGTLSTLETSAEITLSKPVTVPKYSSATAIPDRLVTLNVIADIADNAPYGKKLAIRLGEGTAATDVEYQAAYTGVSATMTTANVESGPTGQDVTLTTGGAKIVASNVAPSATVQKAINNTEIGRFKLVNQGSRSISISKMLVSDLGGLTTAVKIRKASNGDVVASGNMSATTAITLSSPVQMAAAVGTTYTSEEFYVTIDTAVDGTSYSLKVNQGDTTNGTIYTIVGDTAATAMTIDNSVAMTAVATKN